MDILEVEPDDTAAVAEIVTIGNAAQSVDCPAAHPDTPKGRAGSLRHGFDGEPSRAFLWRDAGGRAVATLNLHPHQWDNTHLVWAGVTVHPEHRRRGYGSAVVEFAEEQVRALGRRSVGSDSWDVPAATAFAAARGYDAKAVEVNRRQVLADLDRGVVEALHEKALAAAADYELVYVEAHTPQEMLPAVAEMTAAINDAPRDDLDIEDEVFPVERIVAFETAMAERDIRIYRVIARHRDTGVLAGHTTVGVEAERPALGWQMDTSVVREHRGHRLGALVKSDMLRRLAEKEPRLESIDTWNAESNDHMIGVNEALGYRIVGRNIDYQRTLS